MKDKRQRMAFNWPYGDPQMLAYMLSAVAASTYSSSTASNAGSQAQHFSSVNVQPPMAATSPPVLNSQQHHHHHHQPSSTPKTNPMLASQAAQKSLTTSDVINNNSSSSPSPIYQTYHHQNYMSQMMDMAAAAGLASPISLYIPSSGGQHSLQIPPLVSSSTSSIVNDPHPHKIDNMPFLASPGFPPNGSLLKPSIESVSKSSFVSSNSSVSSNPVSFKSPAFGLANLDTSPSSNSAALLTS